MTEVRNRISGRANRARVILEIRRSLRPLAVALLGLVVAIAGMAFIASKIPGGGGLTKLYEVRFAVRDATGVVAKRDEVRFLGVPAGVIRDVELRNGQAIVTASIDEEFGPVYRDVRAALRPGTPVQDMYLDILDRGRPSSGRPRGDDVIPAGQTASSTNVADVLDTFGGGTAGRLERLLTELGRGTADRGQSLRLALAQIAPLLETARSAVDQVTAREKLSRRLIHNAAILTGELGSRDGTLRRLIAQGSSALEGVQEGRGDLDAVLRRLPTTLGAVDSSLGSLRGVLPRVDRALQSVRPVAAELPTNLRAARELGDTAAPALRALRPTVRDLLPLTRQLRPLSTSVQQVVAALRPQIGAVDHATESVSRCGFVIGRFFNWSASTFALGDAHGAAPRGDASLSIDSLGILNDPGVKVAPACAGGTTLGGAPAAFVRP